MKPHEKINPPTYLTPKTIPKKENVNNVSKQRKEMKTRRIMNQI
jgi:hypothetical protein